MSGSKFNSHSIYLVRNNIQQNSFSSGGTIGGIILCADFLYDAFLNKVSGNGRYCCRSNLCLLGNRGACNRCIAENVFQYGTSVCLISHKRLTSYYRETGIIGRNLYNTINVKRLLEVKLV